MDNNHVKAEKLGLFGGSGQKRKFDQMFDEGPAMLSAFDKALIKQVYDQKNQHAYTQHSPRQAMQSLQAKVTAQINLWAILQSNPEFIRHYYQLMFHYVNACHGYDALSPTSRDARDRDDRDQEVNDQSLSASTRSVQQTGLQMRAHHTLYLNDTFLSLIRQLTDAQMLTIEKHAPGTWECIIKRALDVPSVANDAYFAGSDLIASVIDQILARGLTFIGANACLPMKLSKRIIAALVDMRCFNDDCSEAALAIVHQLFVSLSQPAFKAYICGSESSMSFTLFSQLVLVFHRSHRSHYRYHKKTGLQSWSPASYVVSTCALRHEAQRRAFAGLMLNHLISDPEIFMHIAMTRSEKDPMFISCILRAAMACGDRHVQSFCQLLVSLTDSDILALCRIKKHSIITTLLSCATDGHDAFLLALLPRLSALNPLTAAEIHVALMDDGAACGYDYRFQTQDDAIAWAKTPLADKPYACLREKMAQLSIDKALVEKRPDSITLLRRVMQDLMVTSDLHDDWHTMKSNLQSLDVKIWRKLIVEAYQNESSECLLVMLTQRVLAGHRDLYALLPAEKIREIKDGHMFIDAIDQADFQEDMAHDDEIHLAMHPETGTYHAGLVQLFPIMRSVFHSLETAYYEELWAYWQPVFADYIADQLECSNHNFELFERWGWHALLERDCYRVMQAESLIFFACDALLAPPANINRLYYRLGGRRLGDGAFVTKHPVLLTSVIDAELLVKLLTLWLFLDTSSPKCLDSQLYDLTQECKSDAERLIAACDIFQKIRRVQQQLPVEEGDYPCALPDAFADILTSNQLRFLHASNAAEEGYLSIPSEFYDYAQKEIYSLLRQLACMMNNNIWSNQIDLPYDQLLHHHWESFKQAVMAIDDPAPTVSP